MLTKPWECGIPFYCTLCYTPAYDTMIKSHSEKSQFFVSLPLSTSFKKMNKVGVFKILLVNVLGSLFVIYIIQTRDIESSINYRNNSQNKLDIYDFDKEHEKLSKYILESGHSHQDNPLLIELTRKLLIPPSTKPSNVTNWTVNKAIPTNREKLKMVEALLIDKSKPGFYIECGANDGEFISPTLPLEQTYNWTGLLIEANPEPFSILETRNRKAWLMNAAVCTTPFAKQVTFYTNPKMTGLAGLTERKHKGVSVSLTVQCIPFYTILTALNISQVDYLSLDVEGLELEILKTVPFDKIMFKFLTIEHWSIPGGRKALQTFMESKGYVFIKELNDKHTRDSAFIHHSLRHKLTNEKGI